ncbi:polymorphic toxin type 50 domain-containing protein [Helicobacter felis]|uniref:polymorphic toxin type 50 domain-containing protein n=1 Tax=Helicobacter felis TaxID=214 RepID=UPI0013158E8E|nr:polymorphic toxin type 50 domain-containing protein [Helicobacter felis]
MGHSDYIEGRSYYEQVLDEEVLKELMQNGRIYIIKNKNWDEKMIIEHPDFYGVILPHEKIKYNQANTHKQK